MNLLNKYPVFYLVFLFLGLGFCYLNNNTLQNQQALHQAKYTCDKFVAGATEPGMEKITDELLYLEKDEETATARKKSKTTSSPAMHFIAGPALVKYETNFVSNKHFNYYASLRFAYLTLSVLRI